ncbi:MAG TPA: NADH-quinone oxidoreductase subunit A [Acidobacteriota bacterium]
MGAYASIILMFAMVAVMVGGMLLATHLLGPKRPNPIKAQPFECGYFPKQSPQGRFAIKFYIVAILFILFDVDLAFLFPWAVAYRELGLFGLIEMTVFLGMVGVGLFYVWKKGVLEWE